LKKISGILNIELKNYRQNIGRKNFKSKNLQKKMKQRKTRDSETNYLQLHFILITFQAFNFPSFYFFEIRSSNQIVGVVFFQNGLHKFRISTIPNLLVYFYFCYYMFAEKNCRKTICCFITFVMVMSYPRKIFNVSVTFWMIITCKKSYEYWKISLIFFKNSCNNYFNF
jgi:hypothetical protein